jgi:hypothetical protein
MTNKGKETRATATSFSTSSTTFSGSISADDRNPKEQLISGIHDILAMGTLVTTVQATATGKSDRDGTENMVPITGKISSYVTTSTLKVKGSGSTGSGTAVLDTVTTDGMRMKSIMEELFTLTEEPETSPTTKLTESQVMITSTVTSVETEIVTRALLGQTSPSALTCGNPGDLPGRSDADPQFVKTSSFEWCFLSAVEGFMQADDDCVIDVRRSSDDVLYEYSICWAGDCVGEPQDKQKPLGEDGPRCEDILYKDCWQACRNNEGVGGQVQAGCLIYKVRTGVGKSQGYA